MGRPPNPQGSSRTTLRQPDVSQKQYLDWLSQALGQLLQGEELVLAGLQSTDAEVVRLALAACPKHLETRQEALGAAQRLQRELHVPPDWNMFSYAKGDRLEGGMGGRRQSTVVRFDPQGRDVQDVLQKMFDATYRKVYTRDRRGAPIPDSFRIVEVYRILNDQVWREYSQKREEVRGRLQGKQPQVPEKPLATSLRGATVLPALDRGVNEQWLFHGTSLEGAMGIAENDFRLDLTGCNAGTLYGKGIYLAENVTKSDEYGEGPKGPAGEQEAMGFEVKTPPGPPPELVRNSYILLCRSTLGEVFYTAEQRPNANALQKNCLAGHYDSVLGDRLKINNTFRELIVYSDDQVYPEYVVKYERIFFHERFADIYRAMLERKRRRQYRGPTPEEKEVLTSMWNVFAMPNKGTINKYQLLDLLKAIKQPPENEDDDLDATFNEWDLKKDGKIDLEEFLQEMHQRVNDEIDYS